MPHSQGNRSHDMVNQHSWAVPISTIPRATDHMTRSPSLALENGGKGLVKVVENGGSLVAAASELWYFCSFHRVCCSLPVVRRWAWSRPVWKEPWWCLLARLKLSNWDWLEKAVLKLLTSWLPISKGRLYKLESGVPDVMETYRNSGSDWLGIIEGVV